MRLDQAARLILRDPELARDAVQEGLIRAWRDLPGFATPTASMPGCIDSTVNACIDQTASPSTATDRGRADARSMPRPSPTSSGALADRDLVDGVLRRLDERGRAIVVLHYYLGMPLTEVAATLGIPLGTVKSRLHRALGEMRVAIGDRRRRPRAAPSAEGSSHDDRTSPRARPARDPRRPGVGPYPDYIDDVLATTAQRRQRPAWTFPERWLPMDITTHASRRPRASLAAARRRSPSSRS